MNEDFKGFKGFVRGVLSEGDGSPSASRIIMLLLAGVASYCVVVITRAVVGMAADRAGLFLTSLPWIIGALAGFIGAPYFINKGGNAVSEALQALASTKKPQ